MMERHPHAQWRDVADLSRHGELGHRDASASAAVLSVRSLSLNVQTPIATLCVVRGIEYDLVCNGLHDYLWWRSAIAVDLIALGWRKVGAVFDQEVGWPAPPVRSA
jgi:enterochelin esterase-like enzyme